MQGPGPPIPAYRDVSAKDPESRPVLIVDGDADVRAQIAALLRRAGYSALEATTGTEALEAVRRDQPALVLLEVRLPDMAGYEAYWQMRKEHGRTFPIFFLSADRTDPIDRVGGLLLGADDFIVKPFAPDELVARIRRSIEGASGYPGRSSIERGAASLTPRERQVLRLVAEGLRQKQIARHLSVSEKTVATHIQRIFAKLDVHSRAELVAVAHRHNLIGN